MSKLDNLYASLPSNLPPPPAAATLSGSRLFLDRRRRGYPHYGEELPPEFIPYESSTFTTGDGHVVSHDPHLNEAGPFLATNI